ncbi:tRNA (adenosine(37)-N6)-threonylcarbamoyltransferase complex dimerization subunit type 1 TsaB [Geofilum rubicundum]|uniref:Metal-dependent protease n=1 Tax=Geofilum rubicundum JCM 15548 TaxID=1236989 RepID=A0A0E9LVS0_9BACT|nr:tRNA (adenosine(37)-N6)-threonylcarbamoyltransferase complex dimerization subunit type 1 TsaB [Geofilum rubicundum]GAO29388.1 metal-dependent protease [Geofilum rubicundum JCM 15548]
MALILCIETSTTVCSVALVQNHKVLNALREDTPNSHSTLLTLLIEKLLAQADCRAEDLDAVAVSSGPGSYTGLRIGVSVAKGICFATGKPLIAMTSLEIMAAHFLQKAPEVAREDLLCPMIDARRMEVYSALYRPDLSVAREVMAEIIDENSFRTELEQQRIFFFGDGSDKCRTVMSHSQAQFVGEIVPLAAAMASLAMRRYEARNFEDVAYFEPFYLKSFMATTPKNKYF